MRGTVAKRLRRAVYGADGSPRVRQFAWADTVAQAARRRRPFIIADALRRGYQRVKRVHRREVAA